MINCGTIDHDILIKRFDSRSQSANCDTNDVFVN